MHTDVTIHIASEADLRALVRLAVAFRDHVGQLTPSAEEFCSSIALPLREASAEFFPASTPTGAAVGYVQCRYRYSAWRLVLEAELEDVFVVREVRRRGVGQRLVAFAIAQATAKGCRSLGLSTNERNTAAVTLAYSARCAPLPTAPDARAFKQPPGVIHLLSVIHALAVLTGPRNEASSPSYHSQISGDRQDHHYTSYECQQFPAHKSS